MNSEHLEALLRETPDPREAEFRPRPLPLAVPLTPALRAASAVGVLLATVAAMAATFVAVVVVAWVGGSIAPPADRGGPPPVQPVASESCRTADFHVRSQAWPDAPEAGGVRVILEALPTTSCVIDTGFAASVTDHNGEGLVESVTGIRTPIDVSPRSRWEVRIYWSGYCPAAAGGADMPEHPDRPLRLSVALEVAEDVDGQPGTVADDLIPVEVPSQIAPNSCDGARPGSALFLFPARIEPYAPGD